MNLDKKKMPLELSDFGKVILLGEREELILGKGWDGLSESLEIAITRFYRQSKTRVVRSISDQRIPLPGYYAAPHQAVNDFGLVLTENRFGSDGEQTFFEEFPNSAYFRYIIRKVLPGKRDWCYVQKPENTNGWIIVP